MYRYLLFTYSEYYPAGGMNDCDFKTNDFKEIEAYVNNSHNYIGDECYVYDVKEDKVIEINIE